MNRATPQMRSFARQLINFDASRIEPSVPEGGAAFRVVDRLRPHLAMLMGDGGFRALLSRALVLAKAEAPSLSETSLDANGILEAPPSQLGSAEFSDGRVALVAQLLGLLTAFIGPTLASQIIREVWPQFPLGDRDFGKEAKSEEAN
jgi:hypothetical protein